MDAEETLPPRRRANDPLVDHLHECVETLKGNVAAMQAGLAANTKLTQDTAAKADEVLDILKAFRLAGVFAKWVAAIAGAGGALIAFYKQMRGG